jgi:hypothetical protein
MLYEWNCTSQNQHQRREISASRALEIIAISMGAVTLHFSEILESLFSLAQYLHYIF